MPENMQPASFSRSGTLLTELQINFPRIDGEQEICRRIRSPKQETSCRGKIDYAL